jgi:hypothetical protein
MKLYKLRRVTVVVITLLIVAIPIAMQPASEFYMPFSGTHSSSNIPADVAKLAVKGRAPKTGYERSQFGNGWQVVNGCDVRNIILARDLTNEVVDSECNILSGILTDPYTGEAINFTRGKTTSDDVQIDHVVALSDAWQKGAQQLTYKERVAFANDPLNLLAVDGKANQQKSDADAATWLPANKSFRCEYVQRQVKVKIKYSLWVTMAERATIVRILSACRNV